MGKQYNPWDPCYQMWKSFINTTCLGCSKMQILFKVQAFRNNKHHKYLDNLECLDKVLKDINNG